mgnify:CR=1 FL=1
MNKLQELLDKCNCGVYLTVNQHRNYYLSVDEHLNDMEIGSDDLDQETRYKMVELNTIIEIQFYPDTPIGFYRVYHYDLDKAIDEALSCLK